MNPHIFLELVVTAFKTVSTPRFYKTERGFQGRFACALYKVLDARGIFPDDLIIEEEYQKSIKDHGIRLRPDLLIHIPVESSGIEGRDKNNFVAFAFKKNASANDAKSDFNKLEEIVEKLNYLLIIFVNLNSESALLKYYSGQYKDRIHGYAIEIGQNGQIMLQHEYFVDEDLKKNIE